MVVSQAGQQIQIYLQIYIGKFPLPPQYLSFKLQNRIGNRRSH